MTPAKTAEPCNQCVSCEDISQGRALDVFEMDAASNRGIDTIRDLRENVKLSPATCTYKIYIIDEAHMLSTEAFNALLKKRLKNRRHMSSSSWRRRNTAKFRRQSVRAAQDFDFRHLEDEKIIERLQLIAEAEEVSSRSGCSHTSSLVSLKVVYETLKTC